MNEPTDCRGAVPRAERGARAPERVCGAEVELQPVYLNALRVIPGDLPAAEPGEVFDPLRCVLEAGHPGPHYSLARGLPVRYPGEVWACWRDGGQPSGAITLPDCPAVDPDDRDEACLLFNNHAGAHSWALTDPEDDDLRDRVARLPGPFGWMAVAAAAPETAPVSPAAPSAPAVPAAAGSGPQKGCEHRRTEKRSDGKKYCTRCKRQIYL